VSLKIRKNKGIGKELNDSIPKFSSFYVTFMNQTISAMQHTIQVSTDRRNGLYDITRQVEEIVTSSKIETGLVHVFVRHATAAIMIQENWDDSVQTDVVNLLNKLIPHGEWLHDRQDGNGDAHLKAGVVGPSESIPVSNGKMVLGTWQNIFLCEFDGPRRDRKVLVTVAGAKEKNSI
jgi:secondary thiamine-phosphate synthase enzyme